LTCSFQQLTGQRVVLVSVVKRRVLLSTTWREENRNWQDISFEWLALLLLIGKYIFRVIFAESWSYYWGMSWFYFSLPFVFIPVYSLIMPLFYTVYSELTETSLYKLVNKKRTVRNQSRIFQIRIYSPSRVVLKFRDVRFIVVVWCLFGDDVSCFILVACDTMKPCMWLVTFCSVFYTLVEPKSRYTLNFRLFNDSFKILWAI
jgi:hypothetical protein